MYFKGHDLIGHTLLINLEDVIFIVEFMDQFEHLGIRFMFRGGKEIVSFSVNEKEQDESMQLLYKYFDILGEQK